MFDSIYETGFLKTVQDVPQDLWGTEEGLAFMKERFGLPVEIRLSDTVIGNGLFNRMVINLVNEETTLNPWASTFVKDRRELVLLFQTDADAVYFKLLMHA